MFGLLIVLLITYISITKTKGPNKLAVSGLKDQFVELVSTISLLDSRDKKYEKAVKELGGITLKFNDEMRVLKRLLNLKPTPKEPLLENEEPTVHPRTVAPPSERFGRFKP
jgi:hypothetical protein